MKYLIVGNGDYAVMMKQYLKNTENIHIDGFTVEKSIITEREIYGTPVYSSDELKTKFTPDSCVLLMGIGYRSMNRIKQKEFCRYKDLGFSFINYIHPSAIIESDVQLGTGNNIFEGAIIQSGVSIGDANLIYGGAMVSHDTVIGNYNSVSVKACIAGCCRVGNNCFLGANSTVRDHINVADFTLLGAGSYMSNDSTPYQVIVSPKSYSLDGKSSLEFI